MIWISYNSTAPTSQQQQTIGEVWEPGCVKCGRQGACILLTEWATRCKGGQGANKSGQGANKAGQGASKAGQSAAPG